MTITSRRKHFDWDSLWDLATRSRAGLFVPDDMMKMMFWEAHLGSISLFLLVSALFTLFVGCRFELKGQPPTAGFLKVLVLLVCCETLSCLSRKRHEGYEWDVFVFWLFGGVLPGFAPVRVHLRCAIAMPLWTPGQEFLARLLPFFGYYHFLSKLPSRRHGCGCQSQDKRIPFWGR